MITLTLTPVEVGEVVAGLEANADYYAGEIHRMKEHFDTTGEKKTPDDIRRIKENETYRDACLSVVRKVRKANQR